MRPTGLTFVLMFRRTHRLTADSTYLQPFKGINPATFEDSSSDWLELLDGGSNHEKAPLSSLLVKARALDVIVVIDGSADDSNSWPK